MSDGAKGKNAKLGELLGLEPVDWVMKKERLMWFGRVEHKADADALYDYIGG